MPDKYTLTAKQVAELFGVTVVTVYNWARKGTLSSNQTADGIRFNEVEVNKLLDELRGYTLKTVDVMDRAGVSRPTVVNWVLKTKKLPMRKTPGGEFRFRPSEVERFLSLRRLMA